MWARQEDPNELWLRERVGGMRELVETRAGQVGDLEERFYLEALADVLQKTETHISKIFPNLLAFQKQVLLYTWLENYELIHLDNEARFTFSTGLPKNAPLTVEAIAQFYRINAWRREAPCQHAIFLYNDALYHYNNTQPNAPTLTEITPIYVPPAGQPPEEIAAAQKKCQEDYQKIKGKLQSLRKDSIHWAEPDIRQCMEAIQVAGTIERYSLRPTNFALLNEFLPKIIDLLEAARRESRDLKKQMIGKGAQGAIVIIVGMALQLSLMAMSRYMLGGTPIAMAKAILVLKFALALGLIFFALSLGVAAYAFMQERMYAHMANDIAQVQFTKTYPSPQGPYYPDRLFSMDEPKRFADFVREHQAVLEPAFLAP